MTIRPSYDPACFELAEYFLRDEPSEMRADASDLARYIHQAIEDWFELRKQEQEEQADGQT